MKPIDVAGFERKFRENIDPWNYASSPFERFKRRVLIHACGLTKHGRVLELGCANGETTRALTRISLRLLAVDGSATAIAAAKARLAGTTHVSFSCVTVPEEMPRGPFRLNHRIRARLLSSRAPPLSAWSSNFGNPCTGRPSCRSPSLPYV